MAFETQIKVRKGTGGTGKAEKVVQLCYEINWKFFIGAGNLRPQIFSKPLFTAMALRKGENSSAEFHD